MLYRKKIISKNYIYLVAFILICTKFVFSQNDISYDNSWAVIIGIDDYGYKPLKYAVDDAQAIYNILITDFGFKKLVYAIHCYLLWFPCLCLIVLYYVLYTFIK